jgi:uncharacterized membrane protein
MKKTMITLSVVSGLLSFAGALSAASAADEDNGTNTDICIFNTQTGTWDCQAG